MQDEKEFRAEVAQAVARTRRRRELYQAFRNTAMLMTASAQVIPSHLVKVAPGAAVSMVEGGAFVDATIWIPNVETPGIMTNTDIPIKKTEDESDGN